MKSLETIVLDDYTDDETVEFTSTEDFMATVNELIADKVAFIVTYHPNVDDASDRKPQLYVFGHDSWVRYGTGC